MQIGLKWSSGLPPAAPLEVREYLIGNLQRQWTKRLARSLVWSCLDPCLLDRSDKFCWKRCRTGVTSSRSFLSSHLSMRNTSPLGKDHTLLARGRCGDSAEHSLAVRSWLSLNRGFEHHLIEDH